MKMNFKKLAEEFLENSLYAPSSVSWGALSTDGKIYHNNKRSIAEKIIAAGSVKDIPHDVVDNVSANKFNNGVYDAGGTFIRVLNWDKPVNISA